MCVPYSCMRMYSCTTLVHTFLYVLRGGGVTAWRSTWRWDMGASLPGYELNVCSVRVVDSERVMRDCA